MRALSHFSIYRNLSPEPKRAEEARTLMPFLLRLEQSLTLEDVEYGQDPPDFVFRHAGRLIGVELTDLVPKKFGEGGYARKAQFKPWEASIKGNPQARHEFEWGKFTLRESLAAFADQLDNKVQKAKKWNEIFPENWLVMHVASGSPFGELVSTDHEVVRDREDEMKDYDAKITHALSTICQRPHPFRYIILFSGMVIFAFPASGDNPRSFPVPTSDVLARGAAASDKFLDWSMTESSIVEHSILVPEPKPGTTPI